MKFVADTYYIGPYLDTYPVEVKKSVKCRCDKVIPKGELGVMAVTRPRGDSPMYRHKIVCSFECAIGESLIPP